MTHTISAVDALDHARDAARAMCAVRDMLTPAWGGERTDSFGLLARDDFACLLAICCDALGTRLDAARAALVQPAIGARHA